MEQKKILITGANGQLGRAVVEHFTANGWYTIGITSVRHDPARDPIDAGEIHPCDLTSEEDVDLVLGKILKAHSDIKATAMLAGGFAMGDIQSTGMKEIERMMSINFRTAYNCVRYLLPYFEHKHGGRFVLIGARPALEPDSGKAMAAYTMSKSLVFELARLVNAAGEKQNIRASVLVPGIIDTAANREAMPDASREDWVSPEAMAETIRFLLSEAGSDLRDVVLKMY
jgi:NAD(P)-dependent dehydrogenase (short-subunit alcohol dehydrogenase family)